MTTNADARRAAEQAERAARLGFPTIAAACGRQAIEAARQVPPPERDELTRGLAAIDDGSRERRGTR